LVDTGGIEDHHNASLLHLKKKAVFIPIDPPPAPKEIVTMHRYETALKANPEFKKHVGWFTSATDGSLHATALYESLSLDSLSGAILIILREDCLEVISQMIRLVMASAFAAIPNTTIDCSVL
jgi:hypothetical protein